MTGAQPKNFQGRRGLVGLGHFYNYFIKKHKKSTAGKNLRVFSTRDPYNYILNLSLISAFLRNTFDELIQDKPIRMFLSTPLINDWSNTRTYNLLVPKNLLNHLARLASINVS